MKQACSCLFLSLCLVLTARADLTLVQQVEGIGEKTNNVTIRVKGELARIDASPHISSIVNGETGEVLTLMKDQKRVVRISPERMKAAAEMITRFSDKKHSSAETKPRPTGGKETINGYLTEEYAVDTPSYKALYWLAPTFPNGAAILRQLQSIRSAIWNSTNSNTPDYRDFPAVPVRTTVQTDTMKVTTTLISASLEPLADDVFAVPADFEQVKIPEAKGMGRTSKASPAASSSPHR